MIYPELSTKAWHTLVQMKRTVYVLGIIKSGYYHGVMWKPLYFKYPSIMGVMGGKYERSS